MVWVGIMADGHTNLYVFDRGTLTGQWYRDDILVPYVKLFYGAYEPNPIFMDDNTLPHRDQLDNEYLQSEHIERLEWVTMPLTLISCNMYETSLDAQLQIEDQLQ
ncbi:DDE_3 domain-containing protein [Trichonephila clavipes]|uniref:DDE_3 domain-containing protein n=1 Tax=Trichonephila clavipes TaxID=2585209 RepID=A0A8X6UWS2_TRICX|nr:DDE_3 domain-containing protein [Trichonephila clavipes]